MRFFSTLILSTSLLMTSACIVGDDSDTLSEQDDAIATIEQEIRRGGAYAAVPVSLQAIGRVNGCTATIINEYTAITSLDCVTDNANETFFAPSNRGTITGKAIHHPLGGHAYEYNVALIRFPTSIYNTPSLNAVGLEPIAVHGGNASPTNFIAGYGARDNYCATAPDGKLSLNVVYASVTDIDRSIDINSTTTTGVSACPGDLGGPMLTYLTGGSLQIVGIMAHSYTNHTLTRVHPVKTSYEWIRKHSARPDIDNNSNLSGNCVVFDGTSPISPGLRATFNNGSSDLGFWNNRISSVWVKKGFKLIGYDNINYYDQMGTYGGYDGESCNEQGCFHDLTGTSNDNDISSMKCVSILPTSSSASCILYDQPGNSAYAFSGHQNLGTWSDRAHYIWIKNGHNASMYRGYNFTGEVYTYTGNSGTICNSAGCLRDLSETRRSGTISAIRCN